MNHHRHLLALGGLFALLLPASGVQANDFFEAKVRPVLVAHCIKCHGPEKQRGGLRLDSRAAWQSGGDSGPVIVPGKPEQSLLIKAVRATDKNLQMPPGKKLAATDVAALQEWIRNGAVDPRDGGSVRLGGVTLAEAKKWWSFQPVRRPEIPSGICDSPVDAFLVQKLRQRSLTLSPRADRRTLIRRATYDLIGLPPSPEEVEAFVKDTSPDAFSRVVDRLLTSPHYGERWGRHWLDLVRYADTAGENSDHPLPHAWRYRNWVIDAVNQDMPYDAFLKEQLAGDILARSGPSEKYASRIIATGYLALSRRFGHDIDKDMHLTHEDTIDTLGKAFLGLTLGCARCHDHKYDAVSSRDYYALYGIFDSTRFAYPGCEPNQMPRDLVPLLNPAEWNRVVKPYQQKRAMLEGQILQAQQKQAKYLQKIEATKPIQELLKGGISDGGEQTFQSSKPVEVKVGQLLQFAVTPQKNHGADSTFIEWEIAEVGGKQRTWNLTADVLDSFLAGNPHSDRYSHPNVWWFFDARKGLVPLPEMIRNLSGKTGLHVWRNGDTPSVFVNASKSPHAVWTKLPARSLFVHPGPTGGVAVGWLSPVDAKVTIKGRIKDAHPGGPDGVDWMITQYPHTLAETWIALAGDRKSRTDLQRQLTQLQESAPRQEFAYAVQEGKPHDVKLHLRGDPEKPGPVVARRWLEIFGGKPIDTTAGSGRLQLAEWIASPQNPLTARVMVNRIWLHHFGKGLVKTPNDFGTRGLAPTHPELLDWLAAKFIASGWSVKATHRTIMLSAAYQQASEVRDDAAKVDPSNDLYWRFERRRLSAEELRDSLLLASGQLDTTPGGPHPFPPETSWRYTQHVPFSTFFETDKRSVYLITLRNRRHPFLGLFDGADPNATTPIRQQTTVPTQSLYFMNDPFFHAQAEKVTARIFTHQQETSRLNALFRQIYQRLPRSNERETAKAFLTQYGAALSGRTPEQRQTASWNALTRVLLAGNEFLYLD